MDKLDYDSLPVFNGKIDESVLSAISSSSEKNKEKEQAKETEKKEQPKPFSLNQHIYHLTPKSLSETEGLIHSMMAGAPGILDFSNTDESIRQRVLDFVAGAACALNATVTRMGNSKEMYLITPSNMYLVEDRKI